MKQLNIVTAVDQLADLYTYLLDDDKQFVSYDTETTGTDIESKIIGLSLSAELDVGYYVILHEWNVTEQRLVEYETNKAIKPLLELLKKKQLIMHNAIFDCRMTYNNYKVSLIDSVHTDTMILGHVLDENRSNGLKELAVSIFGDDVRTEQVLMKESVHKNGGQLTKEHYELYKADAKLIAEYGAQDAILTLKLFYHFVPQLYIEGLDKFFYEEESMPLLKTTTYELNDSGLRVDPEKLQLLKSQLQTECLEAKSFVYKEIDKHVKTKYKGTSKATTFNIGSSKQLAWLLYFVLDNEFLSLTEVGKEVCKALELGMPYSPSAKRAFIRACIENKGRTYSEAEINKKTKKLGRPKKIGDPWNYIQCGKEALAKVSPRYKWAEKLLEHNKNLKILNTYVEGIQGKMKYNIIRPSFLQHGTTSGRYSSKQPNFQNLPKNDKRVKSCIVSRPGHVFVGADYSQLEPRVFTSVSQDPTLLECFKSGKDFYSVVGMPIFGKDDCTPYKEDENSFANKYPKLRDISKAFALATPYGTSAFQQSQKIGKSKEECQDIIDRYFSDFPRVELMMLESHETAKKDGKVYNLYGRPRRIPEAKEITKIYGNSVHGELPYSARTLLNLSMNHRVQSSAASIVNRAAIALYKKLRDNNLSAKIVLQVHDSLIIECLEKDKTIVANILQDCMENTTTLPGVKLIAIPQIGLNLSTV